MYGQTRLLTVRVCVVIAIVAGGYAVNLAGQAPPLPAPWLATDVGSPSPAGSSSLVQGTLTATVGGKGIAGNNDQFHFDYQQVAGDVEVTARVDSVAYTDSFSSSGVMIRASLSANAAHVSALASAGSGLYYQRRLKSSGKSQRTYGEPAGPPRWLRVVRLGSTVTAYSSADGSAWTTMGSATLPLGASAYVGVATTSDLSGVATEAQLSNISIVPLSLPAPQQGQDVGAPAITGSAQFRLGSYTISAGGADIGGTSDQFYYVYKPLQGDADVVARVAALDGSMGPAKAGVMIRGTLSAGSPHAFALVGAGQGYAFDRRIDSVNGATQHTAGQAGAAPGWVRLVRSGSQFQAFSSTNGQTWTLIGSDTVPMVDPVYVGLAVTSANASAATVAVADSFTITQSNPPVNQPPTVSLTTSGTTFTAPASITLNASASDPENRLDRVEFYSGATLLGTDTGSPFSLLWTPVAVGTYSLTAKAFDLDGGSATSSVVTITVQANQPPTVGLTSPSNGATYTAPASIAISADASDPEGQLTKVEFYNGATLIGTATLVPYTMTWASVAAGTYSLTAKAYDGAGNTKTSSAVSVTVSAATVVPAKAIFQASSDHATLVTSYRLDVFANGADPNTATPIASSDLGKGTPDVNNDITVDRAAFFSALNPGTYVATVSAIGSAGQNRSASITFVR